MKISSAGDITITGDLTVGVDDTGHDVKFFGATAGHYMLWDESVDDLRFSSGAGIDIMNSSDSAGFRLYQSSDHSYIMNYTGTFNIFQSVGDSDVHIYSDDGSGGFALYFTADGSSGETKLYHYGSEKLATKSTGVDVTGVLTTDGATFAGDVTFAGDNYNVVWDKSDNQLEFGDSAVLALGAGNNAGQHDLEIYHYNDTNWVQNYYGNLEIKIREADKKFIVKSDNSTGSSSSHTEYIIADGSNGEVQLYHYGVERLATKSTGVEVTGVITGGTLEATTDTAAGDNAAIGYTAAEGLILTGQGSTSDITVKNDADATVFTVPTGTDDIKFPDNAKTIWGDDGSLSMYHDGSNSYIINGSGGLIIQENGWTGIKLRPKSGVEGILINASSGNATSVDLYYAGNKKLETTSTGVAVTGNITTTDQIVINDASNDAWTKPLKILAPGLSDGRNAQFGIGVATSANNYFEHTHHQTSSGSASNYYTMGYQGGTVRQAIKSDGKVSMGTHYNSPLFNQALTVTGSIETTAGIELGHASDTTISRVSAGVLAVEGKNIATVDDATALAIALG